MNKAEEESLFDALTYCHVPSLPENEDKESIWIRAIAKVVKRNGSVSYVYVEKDPKDLTNRIVKDFGAVSPIHEIVEYYPFSYLTANFLPEFKTKKKEERIAYLKVRNKEKDFSQMTLAQLQMEIYKIAVANQLASEKQR